MKEFMNEDFLLSTGTAQRLYHEYAESMPIFDYHCHLNPKEIAENIQFSDIGQLLLGGDHYKWRAMAAFGIDESCIRGSAGYFDKFMAYAKMLPMAIGNPLYHWTHLELKRVFGIAEPLNEKTAPAIWEQANAMLATDDFRARRLIEKFGVKLVCTTDDPADSLEYHKQIANDRAFSVKVLPAFRPDKAIHAEKGGFSEYIAKLSAVSGVEIRKTRDVIDALSRRVEYFHACGARISDHGLDAVPYADVRMDLADAVLEARLQGKAVYVDELAHYKTAILTALGEMYHARGWVQQYHMNALRNNNSRMFAAYGPDAGFDSIADAPIAYNLSRLMDAQDRAGHLPKTILYTLNPAYNYVLAAMAGNFQADGMAGKIQFGSGWWFCDQRDGMAEQMKTLASIGLLSTFVGMLTDSRSFVSYPRHEYFRRILCDILGTWVENGEYPADYDALGTIVKGICFENAKRYFGIPL